MALSATPSFSLNTSGDSDSTTCMGSPCQCLIPPSVNKFFVIPTLSLLPGGYTLLAGRRRNSSPHFPSSPLQEVTQGLACQHWVSATELSPVPVPRPAERGRAAWKAPATEPQGAENPPAGCQDQPFIPQSGTATPRNARAGKELPCPACTCPSLPPRLRVLLPQPPKRTHSLGPSTNLSVNHPKSFSIHTEHNFLSFEGFNS